MNNDISNVKKGSIGGGVKFIFILVTLVLIGLGGYSAYRIYKKQSVDNTKPISNVDNVAVNIPTTSIPTPEAEIPLLTQTPVPSIKPSPTQSPKLSMAPSQTQKIPSATPTETPKPTLTLTPTAKLITSIPTFSEDQNLPVAGVSWPTVILLAGGVLLLLPAILL